MQSKTTPNGQIGATLGLDSSFLKWLVRHAAWTLATFHVGSDGMTVHQPCQRQTSQSTDCSENLFVNWLDGCGLGFNTRTGEHIVSNNAAVVQCRSIRRRNKDERWNCDVLLGILGNPWSLHDGRVEVDPNPAAPARHIPMVNPEVEAGTDCHENQKRRECQTHLHHEEDGV